MQSHIAVKEGPVVFVEAFCFFSCQFQQGNSLLRFGFRVEGVIPRTEHSCSTSAVFMSVKNSKTESVSTLDAYKIRSVMLRSVLGTVCHNYTRNLEP